jgi:hypothetical protein
LGIDSDEDSDEDDNSIFGYGDDTPLFKKPKLSAGNRNGGTKTTEKSTAAVKVGKNNPSMMNTTSDVIKGTTESGTPFTWSPIYWQTHYKNADRKNNVCVVLTLPKGVGTNGDISGSVFPSVSDDGLSLIVKCEWPEILLDTALIQHALLKEGVRMKTVVSLGLSAEDEIAEVKRKLCNVHSTSVIVTGKIPLKVVCENKIQMVLLVSQEGNDGLIGIVMFKAKEEEEKVLVPIHNMGICNYNVKSNMKRDSFASYAEL